MSRPSGKPRIVAQQDTEVPAPSCGAAEAGAVLTIDLGAVRENFRRLRQRLGSVPCAAVVKADAYGLGAEKVAEALVKEGCDRFFVAHVSEGLALRRAVGQGPAIHVLNGVPPGAETQAATAGLVPVLNSIDQLRAWRDAARRLGRILPAAIQVDSGMSRLGMPPVEVAALATDLSALDGLSIGFVMSHLACADEPEHPANAMQLANFHTLRALLPALPASFANSSGIFLDSAYHFDLARPGMALYGLNPTPGRLNPMQPVITLSAKIIQTREVPKDTGVGYGHAFRAPGPLRVATISLGYADGWHRGAAASAYFEGVRLPFAGRVSMDSIIIDITALPPGRLKAGDLVELIGPNQTVEDVAGFSGTIGYEVLTGLGRRFHRIYTGG